jgi:hypothetical protein
MGHLTHLRRHTAQPERTEMGMPRAGARRGGRAAAPFPHLAPLGGLGNANRACPGYGPTTRYLNQPCGVLLGLSDGSICPYATGRSALHPARLVKVASWPSGGRGRGGGGEWARSNPSPRHGRGRLTRCNAGSVLARSSCRRGARPFSPPVVVTSALLDSYNLSLASGGVRR